MRKNILVTGAAGFIGFHLAKALCERGDFVVGLDNFNDYYAQELKEKRTAILKSSGISVMQGDICDFPALQRIIIENRVTHIAHLAAQAGVRYSIENPHAYVKTNIEGFTNILEICKSHPSIKLTYASSSSVYGHNAKVPFSEADRTDHQASLYGMTKKTNELMATTYHSLYGIAATGLRFFTVYGPWGRPDMAYFSFAENIMKGKPIGIFNEGKMQRDFTYIDDIVNGTIAAIDLEAPLEIFNLGNHQPVPLLYFVELLEHHLGKKAIKNFLPMQKGDVLSTYADISHSFERLKFKPQVPIEQGIERFVSWYKKLTH